MKNIVIIQDVSFEIRDFNGTGKDYLVQAYAQDTDESDMYTVTITDMENNEELYNFFVDSAGGSTEESNCLDDENPICKLVMNILFAQRSYGIIRGF